MKNTTLITFLGDNALWSEDVKWLAENRAQHVLGHLSQRVRWAHLYLEPHIDCVDHIVARIQFDVAGQELYSVVVKGSYPQSALCAAFALLAREIEQHQLIAV